MATADDPVIKTEPIFPPPPSAILGDRCASCIKPGTKICTVCEGIVYCSVECQKKDWRAHKHLCKTFKEFSPCFRPYENARRVVYFGQDAEHPVWMWLPVKHGYLENTPPSEGAPLFLNKAGKQIYYDGSEEFYEAFDEEFDEESDDEVRRRSLYFCVDVSKLDDPDGECAVWPIQISTNEMLKVGLDVDITLNYDDDFAAKDRYSYRRNQAITAAAGNKLRFNLSGPVVASTGKVTMRAERPRIEDMSLRAYSDVIAYFRAGPKSDAFAFIRRLAKAAKGISAPE